MSKKVYFKDLPLVVQEISKAVWKRKYGENNYENNMAIVDREPFPINNNDMSRFCWMRTVIITGITEEEKKEYAEAMFPLLFGENNE